MLGNGTGIPVPLGKAPVIEPPIGSPTAEPDAEAVDSGRMLGKVSKLVTVMVVIGLEEVTDPSTRD